MTMDTQHFDVARYLANLPLFQETTAQELQRLAAGCRLRRFGRVKLLSVQPSKKGRLRVEGQFWPAKRQ